MKFICVLSFLWLAFLLNNSTCFLKTNNQVSLEDDRNRIDRKKFTTLHSKFGRKYDPSGAEGNLRFEIFKKNKQTEEQINKNSKSTFTVNVENQFFDLTSDEYKALILMDPNKLINLLPGINPSFLEISSTKSSVEQSIPTPFAKSYEWRNKLLDPRNQGNCGSCWAYASTAAAEASYVINGGNMTYFSPQQLINCNLANGGCDGGWMSYAYDYMIEVGISFNNNYPEGAQLDCSKLNKANADAQITGYEFCSSTSCDNGKWEKLLQKGPVVVAMDAGSFSVQFYESGIIMNSDGCQQINHAVVVVGSEIDAKTGKEYLIVRNSWGTDWGENGHFKIFRDLESKTCLIEKYGFAPNAVINNHIPDTTPVEPVNPTPIPNSNIIYVNAEIYDSYIQEAFVYNMTVFNMKDLEGNIHQRGIIINGTINNALVNGTIYNGALLNSNYNGQIIINGEFLNGTIVDGSIDGGLFISGFYEAPIEPQPEPEIQVVIVPKAPVQWVEVHDLHVEEAQIYQGNDSKGKQYHGIIKDGYISNALIYQGNISNGAFINETYNGGLIAGGEFTNGTLDKNGMVYNGEVQSGTYYHIIEVNAEVEHSQIEKLKVEDAIVINGWNEKGELLNGHLIYGEIENANVINGTINDGLYISEEYLGGLISNGAFKEGTLAEGYVSGMIKSGTLLKLCVTLYAKCNFKGDRREICHDQGSILQFDDNFLKKASSAEMPEDTVALLFPASNCALGNLPYPLELYQDNMCFTQNFDNVAKSIVIYKYNVKPKEGCVWLYTDFCYSGDRTEVCQNYSDLGTINMSKKVKSIRFGPGVNVIQLYPQANYNKKNMKTIYENYANLNNYNLSFAGKTVGIKINS